MPLPPAEPPYAYVVEHRPLDACSPPDCRIESKNIVGWWDEIQTDGRRGSYFKFGAADTEAYYRRSVVKRTGKAFEFTLAGKDAFREYDGYFAAVEGTEWSAELDVLAADGRVLMHERLRGDNKTDVDASETEDMARYGDYFSHVRLPLPAAAGERVTIRIKNTGSAPLAIGSPLVLRKVVGRRPRQAFVVIFDSVPEPVMLRMLTGSGDAKTEWLADAIRKRGTLFSKGMSPGFNSPTFVRRFFRSGFFETDGEPSLFGQGIDEEPPRYTPSSVVRLSELGFQTEATLANFLLMPTQTRLGFDGGYQNEQQDPKKMHPPALVRRFKYWLAEHRDDDAFNVIWFSTTHGPFPPGRTAPPYELVPKTLGHSQANIDGVWHNLLDGVDKLEDMMTSAAALAPDVDRVWLVTADHGRTFTKRSMRQPTWLAPDTVREGDCEHCCLASFEETNTPFAILYEGGPPITPNRVDTPTSAVAFWRILERVFAVPLGLPDTTTFDVDGMDGGGYSGRWSDGLLGAVGDSGSMRGVLGQWAFRSLTIRPETADLWTFKRATQLALTGTPHRKKVFLGEELYDVAEDPFELDNVADDHPDVVIELRRKLADWLAVYYDPPTHPRYEYSIRFQNPTTVTLEAPRPFDLGVDGRAPERTRERAATVTGTSLVIREHEESVAIIDVTGLPQEGLLRCASTGLPLEVLRGATARLNLTIARENCVTRGKDVKLAPGTVAFAAKLVKESRAGMDGVSSDELVEGLRRWGYVRDLDKSKEP